MSSRSSPARRKPARLRRRARWVWFVASCVFIALAWPSLGTLPWLALESHHHDVAQHNAAVDIDAAEHDYDASDVPGSPTHPADHNCFECQVLKHLSRCAPAQPVAAEVAIPEGCPVQPVARVESQYARSVAFLPPVRAPPPRVA